MRRAGSERSGWSGSLGVRAMRLRNLGIDRGAAREEGAVQGLLLAAAGPRPEGVGEPASRRASPHPARRAAALLRERQGENDRERRPRYGHDDGAREHARRCRQARQRGGGNLRPAGDLRRGSQSIQRALTNFENEVGRSAMPLEPVQANSDEVYHILRTRLFEQLPSEGEIDVVAQAYAKAVRDAKQMDVTSASPEAYAAQIKDSYPFHFTIRDLYARFRENPGFQQTRGLIRLMRTVVAAMYREGGRADEVHLIHPYDIDLNDKETFAEVTSINPTLTNAIAHDIADEGDSVAESIDRELGSGRDAQDAATLLLVSSLSSVPMRRRGYEVGGHLLPLRPRPRHLGTATASAQGAVRVCVVPPRQFSDGKLFFRNVENLVAKLKSVAGSFNRESQLRELRGLPAEAFEPSMKDCYQTVTALPAVDELSRSGRTRSRSSSPSRRRGAAGARTEALFDQLDYKNRSLPDRAEGHPRPAPRNGLGAQSDPPDHRRDAEAERVAENDPQYQAALETRDNRTLRLLSASRETFTTLVFPFGDQLRTADFLMQFSDNA
jgi:hypothetical protein